MNNPWDNMFATLNKPELAKAVMIDKHHPDGSRNPPPPPPKKNKAKPKPMAKHPGGKGRDPGSMPPPPKKPNRR